MGTAFTAADLNNLTAMGTPATGWKIPPIEWEIEDVIVLEYAQCARHVRVPKGDGTSTWETCPKCSGSGRRQEAVTKKMMVGVVKWPEGTQFRSRWCGRNCGLCGKRIKYSNLLPLMNTANDGATVGMWVGCDCARKFDGVPVLKCYENGAGASLVCDAELPKRPKKSPELIAAEEAAKAAYEAVWPADSAHYGAEVRLERGEGSAEEVAKTKTALKAVKQALKEARAAAKVLKDAHKSEVAAWEAECARIRAQFA